MLVLLHSRCLCTWSCAHGGISFVLGLRCPLRKAARQNNKYVCDFVSILTERRRVVTTLYLDSRDHPQLYSAELEASHLTWVISCGNQNLLTSSVSSFRQLSFQPDFGDTLNLAKSQISFN